MRPAQGSSPAVPAPAARDRGEMPARELSPGVWLRGARLEDYEAIATLRERFGMSAGTRDGWTGLWLSNPSVRRGDGPLTIGWVLEAAGAVVGFLGTIPHDYSYGARELAGAIATSYVVDEGYRGHSLALASAFFKQRGVDLFISTTANEAASRVYQAFGARPVPGETHKTALFWILRPYRVALAAWRKRGLPEFAAPAGAALAGCGSWLASVLGRRSPRMMSRRAVVRQRSVADLDGAFDDLYEGSRQGEAVLCASRRADWLRWHFARASAAGRVHLFSAETAGRLAGYVVVTIERNPRIGLQRSRIADLFVDRSCRDVIPDLIDAAYAAARRSGSDVLEITGFGADVRNAAAAGRPFARALPAESFVYRVRDAQLARSIATTGGWLTMSPYDGDATL